MSIHGNQRHDSSISSQKAGYVYRHQGYLLPSHVQNVAAPSSSFLPSFTELTLPPSSFPPLPFPAIILNMQPTLSSTPIIPSTSQSKLAFAAISVDTSPGCTASTTGAGLLGVAIRWSSAARWRRPWFKAAFEAAYAPKPSSKERKLRVEPESEEMNTSVYILMGIVGRAKEGESGEVGLRALAGDDGAGEESLRRCWAVTRGPMVFVWRW